MQSPFSNSNAFAARSQDARFGFERYSIKRKALQMFGVTLYLYGPAEELILWGKRQAFKFRGDLSFFTDDTQSQEVIRLVSRSGAGGVLMGAFAYDVFDSSTNTKIGAFRRDTLKSGFVQDTWHILDLQDQQVGLLQEDSALLGVLRRYVDYVSLILPQKYHATLNGAPVASFARHKNFLTSRMDIDFSSDTNAALDRRLGLAMAMLLEAVETKN